MSTQPSNSDSTFQQNLPQVYRATLRQFRRITSSFVFFNLTFLSVFLAELLVFLIFLPFLIQSTLLALSLSGLFLTVFSYFVLLFYYQAKKPEQLIQLKDDFIASCRQIMSPISEGSDHLTIADSLIKLAAYLEEFEWQFYRAPPYLQSLQRPISTISALCHWQDVFRFKQILLLAAIDEQYHQIRLTPTDLEVHAMLATTYVTLSRLFIEPKRSPNPAAYRKKKEFFDEQFRRVSKLAIEEFQILNHYAPNDPWVHEQLARGYHDLGMPKEETLELEMLSSLKPLDRELSLRLGTLYFAQGMNAKGLQMYEELKSANFTKADELMSAYGKLSTAWVEPE